MPFETSSHYSYPPVILSTSSTIVDSDSSGAHCDLLVFTNISGAAVDVYVTDRQSTPLAAVHKRSIPAESDPVVIEFPRGGRVFPNGMAWYASAADAIVAWARFVKR